MNPNLALARWSALSPKVRLAVSGFVGLLVTASLLFGVMSHQSRASLFATPLQSEQLAEVQERLASWNVAFTPSADNVLVDERARNDLLLRLSLSGVPHAHVSTSAEMLASVGALTPQSVIDAQARQGLSNDLELGLRGVDGIDDARVIIAPAKPGYFADERSHDATASVRLRVRPGVHLTHEAIAGIRAFIAAGVPGLDRDRVTIVDDRGVALGGAGSDGDSSELQASLQSALDTALGSGMSIVRVQVDYDTRDLQSRETRREPLAAQAITSTHDGESYIAQGKRYNKLTESSDRGSDVHETTVSASAGRVARLSVAVFVDSRTAVELYKIRSLIGAAAGIQERRGDSVSVQAINFRHGRSPKQDGWWLAYGAVVPLLPTLVLVIAALIVLRWISAPVARVVRSLIARSQIEQTQAAVRGFAPTQVRGVLQNEPPHTAAAIISALPAATAAAVLDMYPPEERGAIIARMTRRHSPLLPDPQTLIANA
ncbi:MAG: hypothetical protein M3Y21_05390 [Candidatus Eremiobacteraeota bacterium]|nr:hypothetical protein [Candidatus Eremiobacteraeota bacterium]